MNNKLQRIEYRATYRSTRELDLIFRRFWKFFKINHSEDELMIFESLLNEDDIDIYRWISGDINSPKKYHELVKKIRTIFDNN